MAENKKKWTVADTVIVIVVLAAAAGAFKMFGSKSGGSDKTKVEMQVLIANQAPELGEAVQAAVGEDVTLSLTEKDSGVLTDVDIKPAEVLIYNANDGEYKNQYSDENIDIYATIEVDAEETEYELLTGTTKLKVGDEIPFRGKGYVSNGFIVKIEKEDEGNE